MNALYVNADLEEAKKAVMELIGQHSEEISKRSEEISKRSEEISKLSEEISKAKNQTIDAKTQASDAQNLLILAKNETITAKDEITVLTNKIARKNSMLKDATQTVLRVEGQLSVRGALEYIRARIIDMQGKKIDFKEPLDKTLSKLNTDVDFQSTLKQVAVKKQASPQYLGTIMGTIWSDVSKHFHGRDDGVYIRAGDYSKDECLVLVALFEHYCIQYSYFDSNGTKVDFYDGTII